MNIHCIFSKAFSEIQIRVLSLSNHGQAILVLIGTVISTQGSASDPHALDAERFTGRVIFVHDMRAARRISQVFIPLRFAPGDAIQIDWGEATIIMDGEKEKVNLFCAVCATAVRPMS